MDVKLDVRREKVNEAAVEVVLRAGYQRAGRDEAKPFGEGPESGRDVILDIGRLDELKVEVANVVATAV